MHRILRGLYVHWTLRTDVHASPEDERLPAARESSVNKVGHCIVELGIGRYHHHAMMSSAGPLSVQHPGPTSGRRIRSTHNKQACARDASKRMRGGLLTFLLRLVLLPLANSSIFSADYNARCYPSYA